MKCQLEEMKRPRVANVKNQVENLENYQCQKYLTKAKYSKCLMIAIPQLLPSIFKNSRKLTKI